MATEETMRQLQAAMLAQLEARSALTEAKSSLIGAMEDVDEALAKLNEIEGALLAAEVAEKADAPPVVTPPPPTGPRWKALAGGPFVNPATAPSRAEFHQLFLPGEMQDPWRAWHSKGNPAGSSPLYQNAALWKPYEGGLAVTMDPADTRYEKAGSSKSHEAWIYFDKRYLRARMAFELKMVDPFMWPLTGKTVGLVAWNGVWAQFPGGGASGPENASVRIIWNDWGHSGNPRLGAYLYLGGVFNQAETIGHRANYVSNASHSVEYLIHDYGAPRSGAWLPIEVEVSADPITGRGGLVVTIEGRKVLDVGNLPWFTPDAPAKGWNTGYPCGLFGGDAPEWNPQGGSRTYGYRDVVWSGFE